MQAQLFFTFLFVWFVIVSLSCLLSNAGSFEEDTTLPKGLESWNEEKEDADNNKELEAKAS